MSNHSREAKRKMGAVLLKLKHQDHGYTAEDWEIAKALEGKALVRYSGPDTSPQYMDIEQVARQAQLSAFAHFELTGLGQDFVLRYSEQALQDGKFLLPGEVAWYDSWPWKLLWPAIVSVITTLAIQVVKLWAGK